MADSLTDALKLIGFATPFAYAAATFGVFHYIDDRISDEAKKAVSAWLQPKEYDKSAVAAAVLEMFDRIYTKPLLGWRALFRSIVITIVVTVIIVYETDIYMPFTVAVAIASIPNVITDYVSLFILRRLLRMGTKRPIAGALRLSGIIG